MSRKDQLLCQRTLCSSERPATYNSGPLTCLDMTFSNDEERREYFLGIFREKLKDPELWKIEGFPIGLDGHILAMSEPPNYTACPNPFLEDFTRHHGKPYDPDEPYNRKPFALDVSEGKTDPLYKAHAHHTTVPPHRGRSEAPHVVRSDDHPHRGGLLMENMYIQGWFCSDTKVC